MAVVAYVSDGGLLGLMPLEPATGEPRHRKSHAALSGMAMAQEQLWMLTARDIPANGGLYCNSEQRDGLWLWLQHQWCVAPRMPALCACVALLCLIPLVTTAPWLCCCCLPACLPAVRVCSWQGAWCCCAAC